MKRERGRIGGKTVRAMPANVAHRFLSLNCAVKLAKATNNNNNESNGSNNNNNSGSSIKPQQQQQVARQTYWRGSKKKKKLRLKGCNTKCCSNRLMWLPGRGTCGSRREGQRGCRNPRTTILRLFALRLVAAFQTKNAELLPSLLHPAHILAPPDKLHLLRGVEFMALFI